MSARFRRWRWIVPTAAVAAVAALALRPRPVRVEVVRAERGPMRVTVDEEARTRVRRRYLVSAPLGGKLLRIGLDPGDPVKEGDPLARVVPPDAPLLDPRDRAEQEARLQAAEATSAQASASVARARVAEATARDELQRKQQLASSNAISAQELELARSEAALRGEELSEAAFAAKVADHQLAQARAALEPGRLRQHDGFAVLAPTSGKVLRVDHESEGVVAPGTALLEIGDPGALEVLADLLTVDAVKVRPGMPAFIDHWGGARALGARVRTVEPSGFTKVSALGVEEQRVRVILDPSEPLAEWRTLGDGFRVEVHVVIWQTDAVLRVPATALFRRGNAWATLVVERGRLRERRVEVGEQSTDLAEVRGGLQPDALVVLHPGEGLRDGMRVEAVDGPR